MNGIFSIVMNHADKTFFVTNYHSHTILKITSSGVMTSVQNFKDIYFIRCNKYFCRKWTRRKCRWSKHNSKFQQPFWHCNWSTDKKSFCEWLWNTYCAKNYLSRCDIFMYIFTFQFWFLFFHILFVFQFCIHISFILLINCTRGSNNNGWIITRVCRWNWKKCQI